MIGVLACWWKLYFFTQARREDPRKHLRWRRPPKMVKLTQTIRRQEPTGCMSMFDHFVGLALKGLMAENR